MRISVIIFLLTMGFFARDLRDDLIPRFDAWFEENVYDRCLMDKECDFLFPREKHNE